MKFLYTILFFAFCTSALIAQECNNQLPNGSWSHSSVSDKGNGSYRLSDLSGGFFRRAGYPYDMAVTITIDCNGLVQAKNFTSDFGTCYIRSGQWNESEQQLTVSWEIPTNDLNETVTFRHN